MSFGALSGLLSKWGNNNTNLGNPDRDSLAGSYLKSPMVLDREILNNFYLQSWVIRRVCDYVPNCAISKGGTFKLGGDTSDQELIDQLNKRILSNSRLQSSLKIPVFFCEAQKEANRTGAALVFIDIDDGKSLYEPVDQEAIKSVKELRLFNAFQVIPDWGNDFISGKLEPDYYLFLTASCQLTSARVHKSRVLPFYGASAPRDDTQGINYSWNSDSLIRQVAASVAQLDISGNSVADKMQRFVITLLKIKDFANNLGMSKTQRNNLLSNNDSEDYETKVRNRVSALATGYSNYNIAIADIEREALEIHELKFAGIPQILQFYFDQAQAASGLPEFILTGKHGGNLSSLNEGERAIVASLAETQQFKWQGNLETIITYLLLSKDEVTQGKVPDQWSFEWEPLWQQDPKKIAETEKIQAETLKLFVDMSATLVQMGDRAILTSSEIRQSVFGGPNFGGTNIVLEEEREQPTPLQIDAALVADSIVQKVIKTKDFDIGLEYLPGDKRFERILHGVGYGHIRGSKGADKEALDCYVSECFINNPIVGNLYKIIQLKDGIFDEDKIMIGFNNIDEAKMAYLLIMPKKMYGGIEKIEGF